MPPVTDGQQHHPDGERDLWGRLIDDTAALIVETWAYHGTCHVTNPGAELALAASARAATMTSLTMPPE